MTHYQQPLTLQTGIARLSTPAGPARMRPVTGAARRSLWGRATVALVGLIQVAIVVLAIELIVSVGYESPRDHAHAPVPALGW